jgi:hypothetical protein
MVSIKELTARSFKRLALCRNRAKVVSFRLGRRIAMGEYKYLPAIHSKAALWAFEK